MHLQNALIQSTTRSSENTYLQCGCQDVKRHRIIKNKITSVKPKLKNTFSKFVSNLSSYSIKSSDQTTTNFYKKVSRCSSHLFPIVLYKYYCNVFFPFRFYASSLTWNWRYDGQPGFLRRGNSRPTGGSGLHKHTKTPSAWIQARLDCDAWMKLNVLLIDVKLIIGQYTVVWCDVRSWWTGSTWRMEKPDLIRSAESSSLHQRERSEGQ